MEDKKILLNGRIIKAIAGFFYVYVEGYGVIECHARGSLRKGSYRPLVGDRVSIEMLDEEKRLGSLESIEKRNNSLIRPEVANVDQALIIFAFESPEPNLVLLDRFLAMLSKQQVSCNICFNKSDLCDEEKAQELLDVYKASGYAVLDVCVKEGKGVDELKALLKGKVTALCGPSGVGKSSVINMLHPIAQAETGDISKKSDRGKHTTRHSELFYLGDDTYIMDTPGFTALEFIKDTEALELKDYYHEFYEYEGSCRFEPCSHTHEPDCSVKNAVDVGKINKIRYNNYCVLYEELKNMRKY